MQWSGDRNGGFSRADPARLYAPPIMDPVYGYQAINVEAQERYPFSLLNWMKRLIAMRKRHPVLGRGSLEIVYPSNRKVLCFLRRDDQETILVVANLSRSVQPVELDLSAFAGLIPIEMWGLTEFPHITDRPYFLSLGPYAAHWFTLQRDALPMTQTAPRPLPLDPKTALAESLPSLLVGSDWETLLDAGTRHILERQALTPFLGRQRWFGAKARTIARARFSDWAMIRPGAAPAFLAMVSVLYTDQGSETYLVPLAFAVNDDARRILLERPGCVLARVTGARKGVLMDGLLDDDVWSRLLAHLDRGADTPTGAGRLVGQPGPDRIDLPSPLRWVRAGDQTNSVAFANERYALKVFRRVEQGPNPDLEIVRFLTERAFTRIPKLAGALVYERPGLEPAVLALAQAAITHQGSGWDFTIDELRRFYESASARLHGADTPPPPVEVRPRRSRAAETLAGEAPSERQPPPFFAAAARWYLTAARTLGRRTAELHLALAKGTDPVFRPEPIDADALEALGAAMAARAAARLDLLESKRDSIAELVRPQASALLAARAAVLERFGRVRHLGRGGCRIRVHGDYHLGQVLRTEEDFVILDFEGEPARSLEERRMKQSPLKDVAGMVRSFSYAAYTALFASSVNAPDDFSHLEESADTWQYWVSDAFVTTYRSTLGATDLVPDGAAFDALLGAFVLDKGLYELEYEINHRPEWIRIPLTGILRLI
jgi:maltose alpha-D-glucosyltransferase/alpha-amylase